MAWSTPKKFSILILILRRNLCNDVGSTLVIFLIPILLLREKYIIL